MLHNLKISEKSVRHMTCSAQFTVYTVPWRIRLREQREVLRLQQWPNLGSPLYSHSFPCPLCQGQTQWRSQSCDCLTVTFHHQNLKAHNSLLSDAWSILRLEERAYRRVEVQLHGFLTSALHGNVVRFKPWPLYPLGKQSLVLTE